jgi:hypothetical protein
MIADNFLMRLQEGYGLLPKPVHPSTSSGRTAWPLVFFYVPVRAEPVEAQRLLSNSPSSFAAEYLPCSRESAAQADSVAGLTKPVVFFASWLNL